jgi:hypothetical protein
MWMWMKLTWQQGVQRFGVKLFSVGGCEVDRNCERQLTSLHDVVEESRDTSDKCKLNGKGAGLGSMAARSEP